jgi:hypothetical protein
MASIGRKAVVLPAIFQGPQSECLLFPKAVVQIDENRVNRRAAFGQKRTFFQAQKSPALGGALKGVWQIRAAGTDGSV